MKKEMGIFILLCSFLFLLVLSDISFGNPVTYLVTEEELTLLETSLEEQERSLIVALSLQDLQKEELKELRVQLEIALSELTESKREVQRLRADLRKASETIERANQLFKEYEKEARRTQSRLTRQRNLLTMLLGLGLVGAVATS